MRTLKPSLFLLLLNSFGASTAAAQVAMTPAKVDQGSLVDEVVVIGTRGSLNDALEVKRAANGFVDAIVSAEIAQFPDLNLAEALQRVPGVTITRNQGEGGQLIVRGFTPDFTRVEINGMSATPTSLGREFNFSLFASELFTRAEVRKTGSADQTDGGLAGTVSLFTPKPFELRKGYVFAASTQASYAENARSTDPRAAIVAGRTWGDKFGIVGTAAYSKQALFAQWADTSNWDRARDSISDSQETGVPASVLDAWIPRAPRLLSFDKSRERLGLSLDAQYRPNDRILLTWSNLYGHTDRSGLELRTDFAELESGVGKPRDVVTDNVIDNRGRIISGVFPLATARIYTTQGSDDERFAQSVLKGEINVAPSWRLSALAGVTRARGAYFDRSYSFGFDGDGAVKVEGDFVSVNVAGVTTTSPVNYNLFRYADYRVRTKNDDETAAQIDLNGRVRLGPVSGVAFGGRLAEHRASIVENKWGGITDSDPIFPSSARGSNGRALGLSGAPANSFALAPFHVDGQPAGFPTRIMQLNLDVLDAFYGVGALQTVYKPLDSYEVSEDVKSAYVKLDIDTKLGAIPIEGNAGVRWARTELTSAGSRQIGSVITPIRVERAYDTWLPSATLKADVAKDLVARFAAGRTINRPKLADLSVRSTLDVGRNIGSSGNPDLDPYTATYYDLGLEWYFAPESLVGVTIFRKDIDSLVETLAEDVTLVVPGTLGGPAVPTAFQLTRPINGDEAKVQGLEFIVQAPFRFLPAPFDRFGGLFNYTLTESRANFTDAGDVSSVQLPGLSKNSFNAVLYYQTHRIDARLAYAWRDEFVDTPFGPGGNPIWQDAFGQLDMSATYNFNKRLALKFEGLNLTSQSEFNYTAGRKDLPVRRAQNDRRFALGLRYTY